MDRDKLEREDEVSRDFGVCTKCGHELDDCACWLKKRSARSKD